MPIVNVEGVGQVNFPDSMSPEQINTAIQQDILPQYPEVAAKQSRTMGEIGTDVLSSVGSGLGSLAQFPGQVYGLVTGDMDQGGLQQLGRNLQTYSQEAKSVPIKAREALREKKISQADGFFSQAGVAIAETLKDPSLLSSFVFEQAPQLLGTAGGGYATKQGIRLLMRNATEEVLARSGTRGAIATSAIMQGADIGTDTYERIFNERMMQGYPEPLAREEALAGGRKAAVEAAALTGLTSIGPGGTIERALTRGAAGAPKTGIIKGTLGEVLGESIEEGGGKLASNIEFQKVKPETDIMEGVGAAAGMGALGGGLFGMPASFVNKANANELERAKKLVEEAKKRAAENNQPEEVQLQLGYDPKVEGSGIYTPIIVNPDGTTTFPGEKNQFAQVVPNELSEAGMAEKYGIPTPEQLKERTFTADTIKSFGISPKANIYRNADVLNADIADPAQAVKVKAELDSYLKKYPNANPNIRKNIQNYLARPEFQAKPVTPTQITEASITPEADKRAIEQRMRDALRNQPGMKKLYEEYDKNMAAKDADKAAMSAFNNVLTPETLKSLGFHPTSTLFNDPSIVNADLTNPDTADQIRSKLMAVQSGTKSPTIKDNIEKYLNRSEFITPRFVEDYLNPPRTENEQGLDHFVFTDSEGNIQSKYGTIYEKNGKKYVRYPENKAQKGGERELNENVAVNPNPDQIELMSLYKAKENLMKEPDDFKKWLMSYGVNSKERNDMGLETRVPHRMFRNDGWGLDELVLAAINDGVLTEGDFDMNTDNGGVEQMKEYIKRSMYGEFVPTLNNTRNMMDIENIQSRIDNLENRITGVPEEVVAKELTKEKPEIPEASKATMEQKKDAELVANEFEGGEIAWQNGRLALIRVYSRLHGDPIYIPALGKNYFNKSIDRFNNKDLDNSVFTESQIKELRKAKSEIEATDAKRHKDNPFINFNKDGVALSKDIDPKLAGVISEWKKLFGLKNNIYISTTEDAITNKENFTGPHRRIIKASLGKNENGVTQVMSDGSRYILFKKSTSVSKMLEAIAHEMGHAHQQEIYNNASPEIQKQLKEEHKKWLSNQKGKTSKELLHSLRSKKTAETTKVTNEEGLAKNLQYYDTYWTSFSEWYADNVARWATTSEKPLSVVERFFSKIANGLRKIFSMIKNQGYLPNETFKTYMDFITRPENVKNNPIRPMSAADQAPLFSIFPDFDIEGGGQYFKPQSIGDRKKGYQNNLKNPVTLKDGTRLSGFTDPNRQTTFHGYDKNGERITLGAEFINPEDIVFSKDANKTANYLKKTLADQVPQFSRSTMKASFEGVDEAYAEAIRKQFTQEQATVSEKFKSLKTNFFEKMVTGMFDEFRAIKKYTTEGYMMARLSKSIDGGLQGLLEHGQVYLKDGALDIRPGTKGLLEILAPLGKEVDQYQIWKALTRDSQMTAEKRSFDAALVAGRNNLTNGTIDGKSRKEVYEKAREEESKLNKSVLDVALESGLIDRQSYQVFSNDINYIPFYKYMEENGGDVQAVSTSSKLTGQYFSKALKGGEKKTNDLMENVLLNWSHILSASMKNQAAFKTVQAAESMGAAERAKPMDGKYPPNTIKVMENGKTSHFTLSDPDLVDAISTISYLGPKSAFLDIAKGFTNALRYGVTLSPAYKVRNLIRDSLQSAAISELGANMFENVYNGLKMTKKGDPTFMSALAGGGIFEMGTAHEGDQAKLIKRLIDKGVKEATILDTPDKIKGKLQDLLDAYNELGNKFENANRLALYKKLIDSGKSHLEASYSSRDLMDFSMQGQFRAVKVIASCVPFFNARLQGLYKLGRDGISPTYRVICNATTGKPLEIGDKEKAQRFMVMSSAIAMASILLYGAYKDDEDFQRREDWDRDNFWWFKIGDTQFRIPKPFEIGAFGTVAERTYEQIVDENVEGKVFGQRMNAILMDTFSLNPVPQMMKPLIDLYANKDSFTGAPIESAGMERLSKQERQTDKTSGIAIALGGISEGASKILTFNPDAQGISPVQMDYAIKAYLGWLGATAVATADRAVEPFQEGTKVHPPVIDTVALGFIKTEPQTQSKYMTQFYQNNARLQSALADMRHYAELGEMDKVNKILEEKGDDIALSKVYDKTTKQLAELRKQSRRVEQSKDMSSEDKRAEMNRLKILMSDMAKQMEQIRKTQ